MPKIIAIFTQEEIMDEIPYSLICETHRSSIWRASRAQRAYKTAFTDEERKQASNLFRTADKWTLKTGVPNTVQMSQETYALWKKLGRFFVELTGLTPTNAFRPIDISNDRLTTELSVSTPNGRLIARDCSEDEYPGIAVLRIDENGKETGAVIIDCDTTKNTFEVRVYSPDDTDGDPVADHVFLLDTDRKD